MGGEGGKEIMFRITGFTQETNDWYPMYPRSIGGWGATFKAQLGQGIHRFSLHSWFAIFPALQLRRTHVKNGRLWGLTRIKACRVFQRWICWNHRVYLLLRRGDWSVCYASHLLSIRMRYSQRDKARSTFGIRQTGNSPTRPLGGTPTQITWLLRI